MNPFLEEYDTPFGIAPFDKIRNEHYLPAFIEGFKAHEIEIEAIVNNAEAPNFENTIVALDLSGALRTKVGNVFYNLLSANTSDELQAIAKEVAPMQSKHRDKILLNALLFDKVKAVYEQKDNLELNTEQISLLEKTYRDFVRAGALLDESQKERMMEINEKLSVLTLKFGDNVLAETNKFKMVLESKEDLAGLPESVVAAAAETAKENGEEGKWMFTIHKPSLIPFLQYSEKRELREKMFKAYISMGDHGDELDNKETISEIVNLRIERAALLGYETHADYILEKNMAQNPANVNEKLEMIWEPALANAKTEAAELQKMIEAEGGDFKLEAWDWWYYAEKLRKEKYDLDEDELRPYFQLENVRQGAFDVATKLFGIQFKELTDVPVYHEEVTAFEVLEADGSHIGVLFTDFFPRASKRGGAWMNSYRKQYRVNGENVAPIITNVMNFTKPTGDTPALLSFDETLTLFHEFGHALHGLLSDCNYIALSGTSVPRDFVELPSQIMENWASEPEVLKMYARHYETGDVIPDELITKLQNSSLFNQGFATTEFVAAAILDMNWHTQTNKKQFDVNQFENKVLEEAGLIDEIVVRYRSTYFRHIFAGGYSSGYYSYLWSAMLDADAFSAFKEKGLFDQELAESFRYNILARGGSDKPLTLYKAFKGDEPNMDALMERKGFN